MKRFVVVLSLLLVLIACAGFDYRYYGIVPSKAVLLGKTEADDRPLSDCEPDAQVKGKCAVMFTDEFERLRTDLAETKRLLIKCQQGEK